MCYYYRINNNTVLFLSRGTVMIILAVLFLSLLSPSLSYAETKISPSLFFARQAASSVLSAKISTDTPGWARVTIRFPSEPSPGTLVEIEHHGVVFSRHNGRILHSTHIYPASVNLDSLEAIANFPEIDRIENTFRPAQTSTLDVSNPEVQASLVWNSRSVPKSIDGAGVTVVDVDTGIDIFHPAFFKTDGGVYSWIDVNNNGVFDTGIDSVDLNANGKSDSGETLRFYDAPCSDTLNLLTRNSSIYDVDFDWLYNDSNGNGQRDYGPDAGYTENSPCFGERIFIVSDSNLSNRLDPDEPLIGLCTSKVLAIIDKNGTHLRGTDLFASSGDLSNHGTGACGIVGGQHPGRRLTGMAPGVDFIGINSFETDIEEAALLCRDLGAGIYMYEFGSWVYEFLDGSSNLETLIDDLYSEGYHQFTASGNLAGPTRKRHAFFTLSSLSSDTLSVTVPSIGIKEIYASILWRGNLPLFNRPSISLRLPDGTVTQIRGDMVTRTFDDISVISGYDYSSRGTARMDVLISSSSSMSGTISLSLTDRSRSDIGIHAYVADDASQWMNGTQFNNYVTDDGTVCSPATSLYGITVGAYDPRGTRNLKGDINDFSSWGKTIDGRRGVDLTAPGTLVYSLISSSGTSRIPGGYFEFGGTSAALPHVVGCAALLMEALPGISPDSLSDALLSYSLQDTFTGSVPNDIWGYGKLRIFSVINGLNLLTKAPEKVSPELFTVTNGFPNPFNASISFHVNFPVNSPESIEIEIFNILGQKVLSHTMRSFPGNFTHYTWNGTDNNGDSVSSGVYFFRFNYTRNIVSTQKALFLR